MDKQNLHLLRQEAWNNGRTIQNVNPCEMRRDRLGMLIKWEHFNNRSSIYGWTYVIDKEITPMAFDELTLNLTSDLNNGIGNKLNR